MSAPFLLFTACQGESSSTENGKNDTIQNVNDSLLRDSNALVLALTPTVDCLPIYYAHKSGIFQTLGLKVNLLTYRSQFDCDTAMLGTTADGGATDLVRLHYYAHKGKTLSVVASTNSDLKLLVCNKLRIKKTSLLKERMIAVARFSASDYYSKEALKDAQMEYNDVFRPQVNDYYLRTSMLNGNQVDAAMLQEPFATRARLAGHRVLYATSDKSENLGCIAFKSQFLTVKDSLNRINLLLKGYNQAVEEINKKGKSVCADILFDEYEMPSQVVDSLILPKYTVASLPTKTAITKVQHFMKMHNRWCESDNSTQLFNGSYLPK